MSTANVSVHIPATGGVSHHCDHPDREPGYASFVVGELFEGDCTIYLCGTPDELRDFADRIHDAVSLRASERISEAV